MALDITTVTHRPDDYYYDADTVWGKESKRLLAALRADPSNQQLVKDLAWAEKERAAVNAKAAAAWEREQDAEYAAQWASWAYGPDVNGNGS